MVVDIVSTHFVDSSFFAMGKAMLAPKNRYLVPQTALRITRKVLGRHNKVQNSNVGGRFRSPGE